MKIYVCDDRDPELICSALETARDRGANIPLPDSVFTDPSLLGTGTGRRNLIEAIGGLNDAAKSAIVEGKSNPHCSTVLIWFFWTTGSQRSNGERVALA